MNLTSPKYFSTMAVYNYLLVLYVALSTLIGSGRCGSGKGGTAYPRELN